MESRKDQLQKQIIEALKANDNDLYSLLKTQWAHRFGVESLEELKKIEEILVNKTSNNEDHHKNDQSENNIFEVDKENLIKDDDKKEKEKEKEKEIRNETNKALKQVEVEGQELNEIVDKENNEKKSINPIRQYKSPPKVEALIPLPPKPKYSFLRKWLLSN
mgnify:CR=1 FL=1